MTVLTSSHYLLEERLGVLNPIKNIDISILQPSDSKFTSFLLFGKTLFGNKKTPLFLILL